MCCLLVIVTGLTFSGGVIRKVVRMVKPTADGFHGIMRKKNNIQCHCDIFFEQGMSK